MNRELAKRKAMSRDCSCVKGKDRDNNYNSVIDEIFDWHESEVKNLSIHGVVKSLKDKEVISFEEFVNKYYKRKDLKYFNKRGKVFTATQLITIYNEHINNL